MRFPQFTLVFALSASICCSSCLSFKKDDGERSSNGQHKAIQIKGSDTMVNLTQAWAEEFMNEHPDAFIAVTGGGSGTGIAALLSGSCDVAQSSRTIKEKEIKEAEAKNIHPQEFKVALDGLAVVVHKDNPINSLTIDQLADIFMGKIRNWKDIGGQDLEIVLLSREVNSGTHIYFKEKVLRKGHEKGSEEFFDGALLMPSSQAIADEISQNPNAVGYYGMGYSSPTQKFLAISKNAESPAYLPTIENVMSGKYYISRPLLFYTNGNPSEFVQKFLDFVLSERGQQVVRQIDFVPIN